MWGKVFSNPTLLWGEGTPGFKEARESARDARDRVDEAFYEWLGAPEKVNPGLAAIARDAGIPLRHVRDFMKGRRGGEILLPLREQVWNASLPQVLRYEALWSAHLDSTDDGYRTLELYQAPDQGPLGFEVEAYYSDRHNNHYQRRLRGENAIWNAVVRFYAEK
jgi:hypothetical protein